MTPQNFKQRITCNFFSGMFEEGWKLLGAGNAKTQDYTQNGTHEKVCEEKYLEEGEKE